MKVFFSVILPTYNQANLLKRCLKSIFNQTYKKFEIIIIDNFSKDNTYEIIKKFDKRKIKYKKISNRGIIAKSRNEAIKLSKGNWISFIDSDDTWNKNKLFNIVKKIKKNNFDLICHDEWVVKNQKVKIWSNGPYKKNFYKFMLKYGNLLSTSATTVKKEFLKKNKIIFDENRNLITSEDYDFFLNVAKKKGKFFFLSKPLGYRYITEGSASSNIKKHKNSIFEVLKKHSKTVDKIKINRDIFFYKCKLNILFKYDLLYFRKKSEKIKNFIRIINRFKKNPIYILKIFYYLILKILKNKFFLYFYKIIY